MKTAISSFLLLSLIIICLYITSLGLRFKSIYDQDTQALHILALIRSSDNAGLSKLFKSGVSPNTRIYSYSSNGFGLGMRFDPDDPNRFEGEWQRCFKPSVVWSYPVFISAENCNTAVCATLIQHGANLHLANGVGETIIPILYDRVEFSDGRAAPLPTRSMLVLLKDNGVDLNTVWGLTHTALNCAILAASPVHFRMLLNLGCKMDKCANFERLRYIWTRNIPLSTKNALLDSMLEYGFKLNETTVFGETPVQFAVQADDFAFLKALIQHGAPPDEKGVPHSSLVNAELRPDRTLFVPYLIRYGANPNAYSTDKDITPLTIATETNDAAIVRELIVAGANLNQFDLLEWASISGNEKMTDLIMDHGFVAHANSPEDEMTLEWWNRNHPRKHYKVLYHWTMKSAYGMHSAGQ